MKKNLFLAFVAFVALTGCKKDPAASFSISKTNYYLNEVIALDNGSTNATSYKWDFGDGQSSTEKNPQHVYAKAGTFSIKLTANGNATVAKSVRIYPGTASYEVYNNTSTDVHLVSFAIDANDQILNFVDHGTVLEGTKADTVFTFNSTIYIGGYILSKQFVVTTPYTISSATHNRVSISDNSQIIVEQGVGSQPAIQSMVHKNLPQQTFNSLKK